MSGLQSNGMSGLQSDTSLNNLIDEISALTLNSGAWSAVRGLRASESRVRRGGRRDNRMGAMGGAELYASRSNCLSNFSMKTNLLLVDLAMRSVAILGLSVAILRLFVAIMRLSVAMIRRSILSRVLNERERDSISWVIKYFLYQNAEGNGSKETDVQSIITVG